MSFCNATYLLLNQLTKDTEKIKSHLLVNFLFQRVHLANRLSKLLLEIVNFRLLPVNRVSQIHTITTRILTTASVQFVCRNTVQSRLS